MLCRSARVRASRYFQMSNANSGYNVRVSAPRRHAANDALGRHEAPSGPTMPRGRRRSASLRGLCEGQGGWSGIGATGPSGGHVGSASTPACFDANQVTLEREHADDVVSRGEGNRGQAVTLCEAGDEGSKKVRFPLCSVTFVLFSPGHERQPQPHTLAHPHPLLLILFFLCQ